MYSKIYNPLTGAKKAPQVQSPREAEKDASKEARRVKKHCSTKRKDTDQTASIRKVFLRAFCLQVLKLF